MERKTVSCLCVLAAIIMLMPGIPIMAAENSDNTIQEVTTTTGNKSAVITYQQNSAFTVTIPKTITLGQNKSATYGVKVKGDIAGNETVTVTPDATVQLEDSNGKAAVAGIITQDVTEFAADQVNLPDGYSVSGNITADDLTSGDWNGSFKFEIDLVSSNVSVAKEPGLYNADGVMVCTWEDSGIDVSKDYSRDNFRTSPGFAYSILETKPEVTSIVIPNSVTKLGDWAFQGCERLTSITIPDSVTSIGNEAFGYCTQLTDIVIPASVTSIGENIFVIGNSLKSITVDSANPVYDSRDNCNAIIETASNKLVTGCQSTIIPSSVTSIGVEAFQYCLGLTNITIPNNVTNIEEGAFANCHNLTNVVIPNSITNINDNVFFACESFTDITIPDSVTSIGYGVFCGCENLTNITIPDSVTSIGDNAFDGCYKLANITIPKDVTRIGDYTFSDCYEITNITIPKGVTYIGNNAFSGCSGLTSITIPNSVTSIGEYAFQEAGLTSVTISDSVISIGNYAFRWCKNLASVTYKGQTYINKSELTTALSNNNVKVKISVFDETALQ